MAIALDNTASTGPTTTASLTWSHTVNSNTDGIMSVSFGYAGSSTTITSVKYNSVAMTAVTGTPLAVISSFHIALYYLLAPSTGANTVDVELGASVVCEGGSLSLTGANQGAPEANNTATGSGVGNVGGSVTTVAANAWVIDSFGTNSSTPTYTPSQTVFLNIKDTTNSRMAGGQYQGPIASPGSTSSLWNISGVTARSWGQILASVAPVGAAATSNNLTLLGVGT